ncbi:transposase family protein [Candidatus Enterovibrio escicola]|uniref:transposase family protein n=1 Tax=Candidatus Enterovibrio escicola TaxID=1927127 RepID=UPI000BE37C68
MPLFKHFFIIKEPRQTWNINPVFSDIILLTFCGIITYCEGCKEIEDLGIDLLDYLKKYGNFYYGILIHGTGLAHIRK